MRIIFRQFFVLLSYGLAIHAILWIGAAWVSPFDYTMDQYYAKNNTFSLDIRPLNDPGEKIVLLGSSALHHSLPAENVSQWIQDHAVIEYSIPSANITVLSDVVDLYYNIVHFQDPRPKVVFVLSFWYSMFQSDDDAHFESSPGEKTHMRYPFLFNNEHGILKPIIDFHAHPELIFLSHPYTAFDHYFMTRIDPGIRYIAKDIKKILRNHHMIKEKSVFPEDDVIVGEEQKCTGLQMWRDKMGLDGVSEEQFSRLAGLIEKVTRNGDRLVLVDLPLPQWHKRRSDFFRVYKERMESFVAGLKKNSNLTYLDMKNIVDEDTEFFDSCHAKPRAGIEFSKQFSLLLKPYLN
ncbi:MAG: hypothetical protein HQL07_13480 [Nitrospirae bacterium]|nr:hypothetical protein [Magnetococcales bacterium]HAT50206.1 hypothetical protein [Alphaproteobacteria bacterium]